MPSNIPLLAPVVAMILWIAVIWTWMYITRIPAIVQMRMRLDPMRKRGEQMSELPAQVRWKADNYNHLLEQPQLFYATAIVLAVLGDNSAVAISLAWAYVALRVIHSIVQATFNHIPTRFGIFAVSSLVLWALAIRAALLVF